MMNVIHLFVSNPWFAGARIWYAVKFSMDFSAEIS